MKRAVFRCASSGCWSPKPTLAEALLLFATRGEIEDTIEVLIGALDLVDGDPDLEPSLGSLGGTAEAVSLDQRLCMKGTHEDLELENHL